MIIAAIRIASTYTTFSETADEPVHLNAGIELLTLHQYDFHLVDPPIPRIAFAIGAVAEGARQVSFAELDRRFRTGSSYRHMLAMTRAGNLPFFALAAWATWAFTRRRAGNIAAMFATFFFTTQPVILGYFGLATHDGAAVAGVAVAMLACARWIDAPSPVSTIVLGLAYGFAVACKFSCIAYVPAVCAVMFARNVWSAGGGVRLRHIAGVPLILATAALVVAAAYGFVLVPRFFDGVREIIATNRGGYLAYLFGEVRTRGWWWYFPATVGLKTTLPFLLVVAAGTVVARSRLVFRECATAGAVMVIMVMPTTMDLGIRYVLPALVPLTIAAGVALDALISQRVRWVRGAAAVLVAWHLFASVRAHPDYFPYFNELAQPDPSLYLIDSNLDWGQDVLRLSEAARGLGIQRIGTALFSISDLKAMLPQPYGCNEFAPVDGWVAVSDHIYRMNQATDGGWRWLRGRPYRRIGKSIRLYSIPAL